MLDPFPMHFQHWFGNQKPLADRAESRAEPVEEAAHYEPVKVLVEFITALVIAIAALPFVLVAALLVKATSRGPAFYSQVRLGKDGREFRIWKLRTMAHDCERQSGARWSTPGDPRITRIGGWLRRSHLDELPQLWNVLRGEMGLVGPRPERPEFAPRLEAAMPRYRERLQMRPGVTGLAQIRLPADTDMQSVRAKLAYDLYYVEHASAWLDCQIVLCTALSLVGLPFDLSCRLLRVPSVPPRSATSGALLPFAHAM